MNRNLIESAWIARANARPWKSGTMVGCAIKGNDGGIFVGWNIEGLWQTSIHAEVCAIAQLAGTAQKGRTIVIASECENFTPCGACLDWLIQFCEPEAILIIVNRKSTREMKLSELYPDYPRQ